MGNLKQCTKCGDIKPATPEFFFRQRRGNPSSKGLHPACKVCHSEYNKSYRNKLKNDAPEKPPYTLAIKTRAVVLSGLLSIPEAIRMTGVSISSLKKWRVELRNGGGSEEMKELSKSLLLNKTYQGMNHHVDPIIKQAIGEAMTEAQVRIQERVDEIMEKFLKLSEDSLDEAIKYLGGLKEFDKGQQSAAWLRAVVYAATQSIQQNQLLQGKPTHRVHKEQSSDEQERVLREVLKDGGGFERTEITRVLRNAVVEGAKGSGGNRLVDLDDAVSKDKR